MFDLAICIAKTKYNTVRGKAELGLDLLQGAKYFSKDLRKKLEKRSLWNGLILVSLFGEMDSAFT